MSPHKTPPSPFAGLAALWAFYEKMVVPETAGSVQRRETQLAFYAGAAAAMQFYANLGELDEDEAILRLHALQDELEAFYVQTTGAH